MIAQDHIDEVIKIIRGAANIAAAKAELMERFGLTDVQAQAIVQSLIPLSDGDAIKLTTAKYFTPNGNYIHGVGIEPDIELEYEYLNPDGEEYEMQYDNQIQKAIEVLSGEE